jgi:hypothetical protein
LLNWWTCSCPIRRKMGNSSQPCPAVPNAVAPGAADVVPVRTVKTFAFHHRCYGSKDTSTFLKIGLPAWSTPRSNDAVAESLDSARMTQTLTRINVLGLGV